MKINKLISILIITVILITNTYNCIIVKAGSVFDELGEKAEKAYENITYFIYNNLGFVTDKNGKEEFELNVWKRTLIRKGLYTKEELDVMTGKEIGVVWKAYVNNEVIVDSVKGAYIFSSDLVNNIVKSAKEIIDENEYFYYWKTYKVSDYCKPEYYDDLSIYLSDLDKLKNSTYSKYEIEILSPKYQDSGYKIQYRNSSVTNLDIMKGLYYVMGDYSPNMQNYIWGYDNMCKQIKLENYYLYYTNNWSNNHWLIQNIRLVTMDGHYIRVFKSLDLLKKWILLNGKSNYYVTNNIINYDYNADNSITINKNNYINNNWQEINNSNYEEINNYVENYYNENGTIITDEKLTNKINELVDSIQELINKIIENNSNENNYDNSDIIEEIKKGNESIVNEMKNNTSLLSEIKEVFLSVKEVIENMNRSFETFISKQNSIINNLTGIDKIKDILNDILKTLNTIKTWLKIDTGTNIIGIIWDIITDMQPVVSNVKTKFPFSVPYDILIVVELLDSKPVVPTFNVPFGIDRLGIKYNFVINLEQFKSVSDISRNFLSLIFVVMLIGLTRKMYIEGK